MSAPPPNLTATVHRLRSLAPPPAPIIALSPSALGRGCGLVGLGDGIVQEWSFDADSKGRVRREWDLGGLDEGEEDSDGDSDGDSKEQEQEQESQSHHQQHLPNHIAPLNNDTFIVASTLTSTLHLLSQNSPTPLHSTPHGSGETPILSLASMPPTITIAEREEVGYAIVGGEDGGVVCYSADASGIFDVKVIVSGGISAVMSNNVSRRKNNKFDQASDSTSDGHIRFDDFSDNSDDDDDDEIVTDGITSLLWVHSPSMGSPRLGTIFLGTVSGQIKRYDSSRCDDLPSSRWTQTLAISTTTTSVNVSRGEEGIWCMCVREAVEEGRGEGYWELFGGDGRGGIGVWDVGGGNVNKVSVSSCVSLLSYFSKGWQWVGNGLAID